MVQKLHAAQAVWLHPAILDAVAEEAVSLYFRREHGRRAAEIAAYADPFFAAGAFISEKLRVLRQSRRNVPLRSASEPCRSASSLR